MAHNHGGYTALHALINAFNTGISKVKFSCYKGVLLPDVAVGGSGPDAGWVCEVNGAVCDPASTVVNDGDKIDFYYNPGYAGMKHVWFEQDFITLKAGEARRAYPAVDRRRAGRRGPCDCRGRNQGQRRHRWHNGRKRKNQHCLRPHRNGRTIYGHGGKGGFGP